MGCFRPPIQCLPRPLSWRLMWPGREVWLLHPHSSQSDTLWSYVSFPHVRIRWFLQNGTERKNPFFNLCGLSVAIIVDMASLTSDMLYLKSVLRLSCNFTFANSVTANLFFYCFCTTSDSEHLLEVSVNCFVFTIKISCLWNNEHYDTVLSDSLEQILRADLPKVTLGDFLLNRHDANSIYPELRMKRNAHRHKCVIKEMCAEFRLSTNCAERACVF